MMVKTAYLYEFNDVLSTFLRKYYNKVQKITIGVLKFLFTGMKRVKKILIMIFSLHNMKFFITTLICNEINKKKLVTHNGWSITIYTQTR